MTEPAGTFDEWRIVGEPGHGYPSYDFVWSPWRNPHLGDPETAARKFMAMMAEHHDSSWVDGPHLHRRTITATDWEPADEGTPS